MFKVALSSFLVIVALIGCSNAPTLDVDDEAASQALSKGLRWRLKHLHWHHRRPSGPCVDGGMPSTGPDAGTPSGEPEQPMEPEPPPVPEGSEGPVVQPGCGWTFYETGLSGGASGSVLFDPRLPGVVYAVSGGVVYRSEDDAASWQVHGAAEAAAPLQLVPYGSSPNDLLAASTAGLLRTHNGARTWTLAALDGLLLSTISVAESQPLRVFVAANGSGVFRSDDGGITWSGAGYGYPYGGTVGLSIDPRDPDTVNAAVRAAGPAGGFTLEGSLVHSDDGGTSWTTTLSDAGYVTSLARCAADPDVLIAGTATGVAKSIDAGVTWTVLPLDLGEPVVNGVAFNPQNCDEFYALQASTGPRRTLDGGASFGPALVNGLQILKGGSYPGVLSVSPSDPDHLLLSTHGGLYASRDAGTVWSLVPGFLNLQATSLATSPKAPGRVWLSTWGTGVWTRDGSNQPWQRIPIGVLPVDYAVSVAADPYVSDRVFVGAWGYAYQSNDGDSFSARSSLSNVPSFAFDPSNPGRILAATQLYGMVESLDGGDSWSSRNGGLVPWPTPQGTLISVRRVAIDPLDPAVVYAATDGRGIFRSRDAGASWQNVFATEQRAPCLLLVPGTPGELYACVRGIQYSPDGGDTWTDRSAGLSSLDVNELVYDEVGAAVYATTTTGVYVRRQSADWSGVDLDCLSGGGAAAIVANGTKRSLLVSAMGTVVARAL